jgi:hypothetical protein
VTEVVVTHRGSLAQEDVSGGSIDIYKCFDQLNRTLLKRLATHAGMPTRVMEPYFRFIDNIGVRYQIGSTIGTAKVHRCSIPQGCPFSMTIVAVLMLPWVRLVRGALEQNQGFLLMTFCLQQVAADISRYPHKPCNRARIFQRNRCQSCRQ